jgi:hypothetical protein
MLPHELDHFVGMGPVADQIPEAVHCIRALRSEILPHGLHRLQIGVHI